MLPLYTCKHATYIKQHDDSDSIVTGQSPVLNVNTILV